MFGRRYSNASLDELDRTRLREVLRDALIVNQICLAIDGAIEGTAWQTPRVTTVDLGPPTRLHVEMLAGQIPADIAEVSRRIAPALGGIDLHVEDLGHRWCRITVMTDDPLAAMLPLRLPRRSSTILIGRSEAGEALKLDWLDAPHCVIQGVTRSGKSVLTYGLLAQMTPRHELIIAGCDPTGLLFRPFAGTRHAELQTSGLADIRAHELLLARLVDEMDRRIVDLPLDRDTAELGPDQPAIVVVMEELAGLYRAADAANKDTGKRIRMLLGRLLAEGHKVGVRVIILVQRAEAAVIDAFARAMCSLRISFRCDNRASVELLHPGADPAVADGHSTAEPGIALMTAPGLSLTRMRAPYLGGYREYAHAVLAATEADVAAVTNTVPVPLKVVS